VSRGLFLRKKRGEGVQAGSEGWAPTKTCKKLLSVRKVCPERVLSAKKISNWGGGHQGQSGGNEKSRKVPNAPLAEKG